MQIIHPSKREENGEKEKKRLAAAAAANAMHIHLTNLFCIFYAKNCNVKKVRLLFADTHFAHPLASIFEASKFELSFIRLKIIEESRLLLLWVSINFVILRGVIYFSDIY